MTYQCYWMRAANIALDDVVTITTVTVTVVVAVAVIVIVVHVVAFVAVIVGLLVQK